MKEECQRGLSENSRKLAEIKYYGTKIQAHLPTLISEKLIPCGLKGFDRTISFYEAVAKGEILFFRRTDQRLGTLYVR